MVDRLGEKLCKELVVEDLEAAATGDLTHCGGVKAMLEITVAALNKNAAVTQTLCIHLPAHIVQV